MGSGGVTTPGSAQKPGCATWGLGFRGGLDDLKNFFKFKKLKIFFKTESSRDFVIWKREWNQTLGDLGVNPSKKGLG